MKYIPYGIEDFERIIEQGYYYVDKSQYIVPLEQCGPWVLLTRPRAFGKSLFLNMLKTYYDINKKDKFEKYFGHLWIGKHPTELAHKFLVFKIDFSKAYFSMCTTLDNLTQHCRNGLWIFFQVNPKLFSKAEIERVLSQKEAISMINTFGYLVKNKGYQSYLFVDTYDELVNDVIGLWDIKDENKIKSDQQCFGDFLKTCKNNFTRIFMTSTVPVTYEYPISDFKIIDNISLNPDFNGVMGFTEMDLRNMVTYLINEGEISCDIDLVVKHLTNLYGYYFFSDHSCKECLPVCHPMMTFRFLNHLGEGNIEKFEKYVRYDDEDNNYYKLKYLALGRASEVSRHRLAVLKDIFAEGSTYANLNELIPVSECGKDTYFKNLLYYLGMLTYDEATQWGIRLTIPNLSMTDMYSRYYDRVLDSKE